MNSVEAVAALGALAQESRLAVFRLLVSRGPAGHSAGEIGAQLGIPGPTLSFHLRTLAQAGLVGTRREGRFIHYSAAFDRMDALVGYLTENCCGLGAAIAPACAPAARTREDALRGRAKRRARRSRTPRVRR